MKANVFIVIPVHNRCATTLRCLDNLKQTGAFEWASLIVVDDGSTDSTAEKISKSYTEVHLIKGDGNLYWTGATEIGMRYAVAQGAKVIFWLNDDCLPQKGALELLLENTQRYGCICIAQSMTVTGYTYGGLRKTRLSLRKIICKKNERIECDTFNGNCVCFPSRVIEEIGYPNARSFPHTYGDTDYGLRTSEAGINCCILGEAVCNNDENLGKAKSWLLSDIKPIDIWKSFFTVKSPYNFSIAWSYRIQHWGVSGIILFLLPYIKFLFICLARCLISKSLLVKIYGKHSETWNIENFYKKSAREGNLSSHRTSK